MSTNFIFTVYHLWICSLTEYVQTVQVPVLLHVDGTAVDFEKEIRSQDHGVLWCVLAVRDLEFCCWKCHVQIPEMYPLWRCVICSFCHFVVYHLFDLIFLCEWADFGGYILLFSLCIDSRSTLSAIWESQTGCLLLWVYVTVSCNDDLFYRLGWRSFDIFCKTWGISLGIFGRNPRRITNSDCK